MRASSSSSSKSANATSLNKRLKTVFKKAYELSILCGNEVCVIHYGPDCKLRTWPEKEKVKDMAFRYVTATKRKKTLNLHEFLEEKKKDPKKTTTKKTKKKKKTVLENIKYPDWYPIFDHYTPHQLSQLILSLEQTQSTLQERARFVEAQKQRNTNFVHHQHHHQYQTQPLNPSQLSIYNGDSTSSQLPLSSSHPNQLFNYHQNITNRNFQQPCFSNTQGYQNHLVEQNLHGFDQNITSGSFQHPCFSSTQGWQNNLMQQPNHYGFDQNLINRHFQHPYAQDYTALPSVQESELKNHLMQQQGSHKTNMPMMSGITNSNAPCLSNTVSDEFGSDFQMTPNYGFVVGSTSSCQDFAELFSSYGESSFRGQ
ncbi:unnamed protein product [Microthlaspi erraticum]|uniref:MADS-box domain-containing protein n=1 Tax=Microthlaspi erraticum TaxID=1685480 RepID=A0A6D2IVY2_9BRAS|nr:unnamed protein product [Microthlaspi erraticum]